MGCDEFEARCDQALMEEMKGIVEADEEETASRGRKKGPSKRLSKQERKKRARRDRL